MKRTLNINGTDHAVDTDDAMPLLWVLRDVLGMTGTKFGCGVAACGACTVLVDGHAQRSCQLPIGSLGPRPIKTIEAAGDRILTALQSAWLAEQVPQCGYCQSGMLMAATALLARNGQPSDDDIAAAISNLCRCGTYQRVRRAIHAAADALHSP